MPASTAIDPATASPSRTHERPPAGRAAAVRRWLSALGADRGLLIASAIVFVLSWPVAGLDAQAGLDQSWQIALHQAVHQGLDFGPDLLFTYGPLGFLREPVLVWPWTARLAFAYTMAVHLALVLALVWGLRRSTGSLLVASLLALVVAGTITQEPVFVVLFAAAIALLERTRDPRSALALAAGLGLLGGIEVLAKFNAGITIAIVGLTAIAFGPRPRRRRLMAFAGGFALAAAVGWFGTGQSLSAIPSFLTGEFAIASGYSQAMGYTQVAVEQRWEYWAAGLLICIGAVAAWVCGPHESRLGRLAVWVVFAFFIFKSGFVRHDPGHVNIFFASAAAALCAFAVPRRHRGVAVLAGLLALAMVFASIRTDPASAVRPVAHASAFFDQVKLLSDGSATNEKIAEGRQRVAAAYALDDDSFALVRDHTVHVDPVDAGLAWAARLRWDPVPIFQTYSAYTAGLDNRNAEKLEGADAPERIIRDAALTIDGRNPAWDSPAAMRAMLCHYRSMSVSGRWQVLEHAPDRCGAPRQFREVEARLGEPIAVPELPDPRSALIVEVDGLQVQGLELLRTALLRAVPRAIGIDDARSWRLVPATAGDGLVLEVPGTADDYPTGFTSDATRQIRFTRGNEVEQPDHELTVRFLAMPIR